MAPREGRQVRFAAVGLDHDHIYAQVDHLAEAGGALVAFWAAEADQIARFSKTYPQATLARSVEEILNDRSIDLIVSAAIPSVRASLGIQAMMHEKDFLVDKCGVTTLEQLAEVRKVQAATGRIYSIYYAERFESRATVRAGELVEAGAIGRVLHTTGLGPHQLAPPWLRRPRPDWFYQKPNYGGILTDIASHQADQFLFFTGSTEAEVVASHVANHHHPQYPELEDFGEMILRGNQGSGYARVDWLTPDGLGTWGDGRLFILGTDGYIELRKYCDISGRPGKDHLFLVDGKGIQYLDCSDQKLPYGRRLLSDVANRTETAMTQHHCFLAQELALVAEMKAVRLPVGESSHSRLSAKSRKTLQSSQPTRCPPSRM
jgi:predicted dehydrogenase